jgi:cysteine desulfurase
MHVNNEIGVVNDIAQIAKAAQSRGIPFHTDAVQSIGKWPIAMAQSGQEIDALSLSFHKLYGPTGIGALVVSPRVAKLLGKTPQICGSQNSGLRGGTDNVSGIAGSSESMRVTFKHRCAKNKHLMDMKARIIQTLVGFFKFGKIDRYVGKPDTFAVMGPDRSGQEHKRNWNGEIVFLGPTLGCGMPNLGKTSPNTLLMSFVKYGPLEQHFCNVRLKHELWESGIIVSIGSACNTANPQPSHVLKELRLPYIVRCGVIRVSLGDYNTIDECDQFCRKLIELVQRQ